MVPDYPASQVGAQTGQEQDFSPAAVKATGMPLLLDGGSFGNTAMTQTGTTGEEEPRTGVPGMKAEARPGGEEVGQDHVLEVVMTSWRSCTAEQLERIGGTLLLCAVKVHGVQMRRRAGGGKEEKGRIGLRNHQATRPSRANLDQVTSGGTTSACLIEAPVVPQA